MKVVIVGAGYTGIQLAKTLAAENNDVVLIENTAEKVRIARNQIDCTVVQSDGNSLKVLEEDAGMASADALVTLTEDDETNMVTCALADAAWPGILKVARVRNDAYYAGISAGRRKASAGVRPPLGIDAMLHPDTEAAAAICRAVSHGAVGNVIDLGGGFGIASLRIGENSPLAGLALKELSTFPNWRGLIAYVESADGAVLPSGETRLSAGDSIGVVASSLEMADLLKHVSGAATKPADRIAVFGAGRTGLLVAEYLSAREPMSFLASFVSRLTSDREVVIVDPSERRCREAKEHFEDVRVLCGDVTDSDFVQEERLDACDLAIAASGNYEHNLVAAAYLKSRGVGRTIALTESSEFNDVAGKLGVDVAVPMRETAVDSIMSLLRGPSVAAVHTVCNNSFEIVSCDVSGKSPVAGKSLRDIPIRGECLLLLARHAGAETFSVPHGETEIRSGDRVVFIMRAGDARFVRLFGGNS